jgi:hypothetical protein
MSATGAGISLIPQVRAPWWIVANRVLQSRYDKKTPDRQSPLFSPKAACQIKEFNGCRRSLITIAVCDERPLSGSLFSLLTFSSRPIRDTRSFQYWAFKTNSTPLIQCSLLYPLAPLLLRALACLQSPVYEEHKHKYDSNY